MIPIDELLSKIKYDEREKPGDYILYYYDRIKDKLKPVKYVDIEKVENGFMVLEVRGEEVRIPLHRIKKVEKDGKVVWSRQS